MRSENSSELIKLAQLNARQLKRDDATGKLAKDQSAEVSLGGRLLSVLQGKSAQKLDIYRKRNSEVKVFLGACVIEEYSSDVAKKLISKIQGNEDTHIGSDFVKRLIAEGDKLTKKEEAEARAIKKRNLDKLIKVSANVLSNPDLNLDLEFYGSEPSRKLAEQLRDEVELQNPMFSGLDTQERTVDYLGMLVLDFLRMSTQDNQVSKSVIQAYDLSPHEHVFIEEAKNFMTKHAVAEGMEYFTTQNMEDFIRSKYVFVSNKEGGYDQVGFEFGINDKHSVIDPELDSQQAKIEAAQNAEKFLNDWLPANASDKQQKLAKDAFRFMQQGMFAMIMFKSTEGKKDAFLAGQLENGADSHKLEYRLTLNDDDSINISILSQKLNVKYAYHTTSSKLMKCDPQKSSERFFADFKLELGPNDEPVISVEDVSAKFSFVPPVKVEE